MQCAIGSKSGFVELHLGPSVNNTIVDGMNSGSSEAKETVEMLTLADVVSKFNLDRIDFMKIDCEGAEYEIFKSAPASILDRITTISMEFHDLKSGKHNANWLAARLSRAGFEIRKFEYSATGIGKNYGNLIATKLLNQRV